MASNSRASASSCSSRDKGWSMRRRRFCSSARCACCQKRSVGTRAIFRERISRYSATVAAEPPASNVRNSMSVRLAKNTAQAPRAARCNSAPVRSSASKMASSSGMEEEKAV